MYKVMVPMKYRSYIDNNGTCSIFSQLERLGTEDNKQKAVDAILYVRMCAPYYFKHNQKNTLIMS